MFFSYSDKHKSTGSFSCHGFWLFISAGLAFSKYFALKWRHSIQDLHFVLPLIKFGSCTWLVGPDSASETTPSRCRERVATLLRCYHAPLFWSLVTKNVANPLHQWESARWLTPSVQGVLVTGREKNMGAGHHLKWIQNGMRENE